jgi:hypothetical protein
VRDRTTFRLSILSILKDWIRSHPTTRFYQYVWKGKPPYYVLVYDPIVHLSTDDPIPIKSNLMDVFKNACVRIGESRRNFLAKYKSEFIVGGQLWKSQSLYVLSDLTTDQKKHLHRYSLQNKFFRSSPQLRYRELVYGGCCYTCTLPSAQKRLLKALSSKKMLQWVNNPSTSIQSLEQEWKTVKKINSIFIQEGIVPLRWHWKDVFTARCSKHDRHGCGACDNCKILFVQTLLVIISAQGVSDELILAHWGSIFRHPRFR